MFKFDREAIRAYLSPVILTVVALFALWKDAKDYRELVGEDPDNRQGKLLKRYMVPILVAFTLLILTMGMLDIHTARHKTAQDNADAQADKARGEKEISDLKDAVKSGNDLLGQQRRDFLEQFSQMQDKVTTLETEVKTSDLQEESSRLRSDLASMKKAMEVPKAVLSFSFSDEAGRQTSSLTTANVEDGKVKLYFNVLNPTGTDALEGVIILYVCRDCKIVETSPGFVKMVGQDDTERDFDFQHVFANARAQQMFVSVIPPPDADSFQIGIRYRCRSCLLVSDDQPIPANDLGTVILGPHWKSNMMNLNRISPSKKLPK